MNSQEERNKLEGLHPSCEEIEQYLSQKLSQDEDFASRASRQISYWKVAAQLALPQRTLKRLHYHTSVFILQEEWPRLDSALRSSLLDIVEECRAVLLGVGGPQCAGFNLRLRHLQLNAHNPWHHPTLQAVLEGEQQTPSDVLLWLEAEGTVSAVERLRQLCVAGKQCLPMTERLARALLTCGTTSKPVIDNAREVLLVILHRVNRSVDCIKEFKLVDEEKGRIIIQRLAAKDKAKMRLWKHAYDTALLCSQFLVAEWMRRPLSGDEQVPPSLSQLVTLYGQRPQELAPGMRKLLVKCASSGHIHRVCRAMRLQFGSTLRPLVCELYTQALSTGLNELESLRLSGATSPEACTAASHRLAEWFLELSQYLTWDAGLSRECVLTAFSLHPSHKYLSHIKECYESTQKQGDSISKTTQLIQSMDLQETKAEGKEEEEISGGGKKSGGAIALRLIAGEVLEGDEGLGAELRRDLVTVLSGPRLKMMTWELSWDEMLRYCTQEIEATAEGTRTLTKELNYLHPDFSNYVLPPPEEYDISDIIEKGYEEFLEDEEESEYEEEEPPKEKEPVIEIPATSTENSHSSGEQEQEKKKTKKKASKKLPTKKSPELADKPADPKVPASGDKDKLQKKTLIEKVPVDQELAIRAKIASTQEELDQLTRKLIAHSESYIGPITLDEFTDFSLMKRRLASRMTKQRAKLKATIEMDANDNADVVITDLSRVSDAGADVKPSTSKLKPQVSKVDTAKSGKLGAELGVMSTQSNSLFSTQLTMPNSMVKKFSKPAKKLTIDSFRNLPSPFSGVSSSKMFAHMKCDPVASRSPSSEAYKRDSPQNVSCIKQNINPSSSVFYKKDSTQSRPVQQKVANHKAGNEPIMSFYRSQVEKYEKLKQQHIERELQETRMQQQRQLQEKRLLDNKISAFQENFLKTKIVPYILNTNQVKARSITKTHTKASAVRKRGKGTLLNATELTTSIVPLPAAESCIYSINANFDFEEEIAHQVLQKRQDVEVVPEGRLKNDASSRTSSVIVSHATATDSLSNINEENQRMLSDPSKLSKTLLNFRKQTPTKILNTVSRNFNAEDSSCVPSVSDNVTTGSLKYDIQSVTNKPETLKSSPIATETSKSEILRSKLMCNEAFTSEPMKTEPSNEPVDIKASNDFFTRLLDQGINSRIPEEYLKKEGKETLLPNLSTKQILKNHITQVKLPSQICIKNLNTAINSMIGCVKSDQHPSITQGHLKKQLEGRSQGPNTSKPKTQMNPLNCLNQSATYKVISVLANVSDGKLNHGETSKAAGSGKVKSQPASKSSVYLLNPIKIIDHTTSPIQKNVVTNKITNLNKALLKINNMEGIAVKCNQNPVHPGCGSNVKTFPKPRGATQGELPAVIKTSQTVAKTEAGAKKEVKNANPKLVEALKGAEHILEEYETFMKNLYSSANAGSSNAQSVGTPKDKAASQTAGAPSNPAQKQTQISTTDQGKDTVRINSSVSGDLVRPPVAQSPSLDTKPKIVIHENIKVNVMVPKEVTSPSKTDANQQVDGNQRLEPVRKAMNKNPVLETYARKNYENFLKRQMAHQNLLKTVCPVLINDNVIPLRLSSEVQAQLQNPGSLKVVNRTGAEQNQKSTNCNNVIKEVARKASRGGGGANRARRTKSANVELTQHNKRVAGGDLKNLTKGGRQKSKSEIIPSTDQKPWTPQQWGLKHVKDIPAEIKINPVTLPSFSSILNRTTEPTDMTDWFKTLPDFSDNLINSGFLNQGFSFDQPIIGSQECESILKKAENNSLSVTNAESNDNCNFMTDDVSKSNTTMVASSVHMDEDAMHANEHRSSESLVKKSVDPTNASDTSKHDKQINRELYDCKVNIEAINSNSLKSIRSRGSSTDSVLTRSMKTRLSTEELKCNPSRSGSPEFNPAVLLPKMKNDLESENSQASKTSSKKVTVDLIALPSQLVGEKCNQKVLEDNGDARITQNEVAVNGSVLEKRPDQDKMETVGNQELSEKISTGDTSRKIDGYCEKQDSKNSETRREVVKDLENPTVLATKSNPNLPKADIPAVRKSQELTNDLHKKIVDLSIVNKEGASENKESISITKKEENTGNIVGKGDASNKKGGNVDLKISPSDAGRKQSLPDNIPNVCKKPNQSSIVKVPISPAAKIIDTNKSSEVRQKIVNSHKRNPPKSNLVGRYINPMNRNNRKFLVSQLQGNADLKVRRIRRNAPVVDPQVIELLSDDSDAEVVPLGDPLVVKTNIKPDIINSNKKKIRPLSLFTFVDLSQTQFKAKPKTKNDIVFRTKTVFSKRRVKKVDKTMIIDSDHKIVKVNNIPLRDKEKLLMIVSVNIERMDLEKEVLNMRAKARASAKLQTRSTVSFNRIYYDSANSSDEMDDQPLSIPRLTRSKTRRSDDNVIVLTDSDDENDIIISDDRDPDKNPHEDDADKNPRENDADKNPHENDADKSPHENDADKTPRENDADKSPSEKEVQVNKLENEVESDSLTVKDTFLKNEKVTSDEINKDIELDYGIDVKVECETIEIDGAQNLPMDVDVKPEISNGIHVDENESHSENLESNEDSLKKSDVCANSNSADNKDVERMGNSDGTDKNKLPDAVTDSPCSNNIEERILVLHQNDDEKLNSNAHETAKSEECVDNTEEPVEPSRNASFESCADVSQDSLSNADSHHTPDVTEDAEDGMEASLSKIDSSPDLLCSASNDECLVSKPDIIPSENCASQMDAAEETCSFKFEKKSLTTYSNTNCNLGKRKLENTLDHLIESCPKNPRIDLPQDVPDNDGEELQIAMNDNALSVKHVLQRDLPVDNFETAEDTTVEDGEVHSIEMADFLAKKVGFDADASESPRDSFYSPIFSEREDRCAKEEGEAAAEGSDIARDDVRGHNPVKQGFGDRSGRVNSRMLNGSRLGSSSGVLPDSHQSCSSHRDFRYCKTISNKRKDNLENTHSQNTASEQVEKVGNHENDAISLRTKRMGCDRYLTPLSIKNEFVQTSPDDLMKRMLKNLKDLRRHLKKNNIVNNSSKCHSYLSSHDILSRVPGLRDLDHFSPMSSEIVVRVVQLGQLPVSSAQQSPLPGTPTRPPTASAEYLEITSNNSVDYRSPTHDDSRQSSSHENEMQENEPNEVNNQLETSTTNNDTKNSSVNDAKEKVFPDHELRQDDANIQESVINVSNLQPTSNAGHVSLDGGSVQLVFTTPVSQASYINTNDAQPEHKDGNQSEVVVENLTNIQTSNASFIPVSRAQTLVNILSQKIIRPPTSGLPGSVQMATFPKGTPINAMALQQALAQILPPPLSQASSDGMSHTMGQPQVVHIVQGKNPSQNSASFSGLLVDSGQQSVINQGGTTQVLHIVQGKNPTTGNTGIIGTSNLTNTYGGLTLMDASSQQQGNQVLHIVNAGTQAKNNAATAQLLKRVNLLTSITNSQGNNEQKMVQFVCKSADGKSIQLNTQNQRGMVLRLQPIENSVATQQQNQVVGTIVQPNIQKKSPQAETQQEIKSRSIYEENYAKFIQNTAPSKSSPVSLEKSTSLPKFNQVFGKSVFQDNNGIPKSNETVIETTQSPNVSVASEQQQQQQQDMATAISLGQMGQLSSPPLLIRKSPQTGTHQNIVQQVKQSMNIQTMHGGVIYTRQIPVNIGGGQTINLITVPSTELMDEAQLQAIQKRAQENKIHLATSEAEQPVIKLVQQEQQQSNIIHMEAASDDANQAFSDQTQNAVNAHSLLAQMRIKVPMLSAKGGAQMVTGTRVVRPLLQIQRNVMPGNNSTVYQQLVLTTAPALRPPLSTQTTTVRPVRPPTTPHQESNLSTSTLEQLREFDMVLEQVKERSTVQPGTNSNSSFSEASPQRQTSEAHTVEIITTQATAIPAANQREVLYSIGPNQTVNVTYVNQKVLTTAPTVLATSYAQSPESSSMMSQQNSPNIHSVAVKPGSSTPTKVSAKTMKSKPTKPPTVTPSSSSKSSPVAPKTSLQKPLEDEQTTQRILYILAEYKEQVENSPDKDKPAPRRRSNPPTNPSTSSKRKKSGGSSKKGGNGQSLQEMSPLGGEDGGHTMGSEDSSCGLSQGECADNSTQGPESQSPQGSPQKAARKLVFQQEQDGNSSTATNLQQRNLLLSDGQTITMARPAAGKGTALLANYHLLPMSMVKGGQQITIVTNQGPKILNMPHTEGGTNTVFLQRLISPAGLKPMLARPGQVRHVRLPGNTVQNLQTFNLSSNIGHQETAWTLNAQQPKLVVEYSPSMATDLNPDSVKSEASDVQSLKEENLSVSSENVARDSREASSEDLNKTNRSSDEGIFTAQNTDSNQTTQDSVANSTQMRQDQQQILHQIHVSKSSTNTHQTVNLIQVHAANDLTGKIFQVQNSAGLGSLIQLASKSAPGSTFQTVNLTQDYSKISPDVQEGAHSLMLVRKQFDGHQLALATAEGSSAPALVLATRSTEEQDKPVQEMEGRDTQAGSPSESSETPYGMGHTAEQQMDDAGEDINKSLRNSDSNVPWSLSSNGGGAVSGGGGASPSSYAYQDSPPGLAHADHHQETNIQERENSTSQENEGPQVLRHSYSPYGSPTGPRHLYHKMFISSQHLKKDSQPSSSNTSTVTLHTSNSPSFTIHHQQRVGGAGRGQAPPPPPSNPTPAHHLRHKYALMEHEARLQKSLSEECQDLGVDSPSASDLFPEAELFASSPSSQFDQSQDGCAPPANHPANHSAAAGPAHQSQANQAQGRDQGRVGEQAGGDSEFARMHPNTTFHSGEIEMVEEEVEEISFRSSNVKRDNIRAQIPSGAHHRPGQVIRSVIEGVAGGGASNKMAAHFSMVGLPRRNLNLLASLHSSDDNSNCGDDSEIKQSDKNLNPEIGPAGESVCVASGIIQRNVTQVIRHVGPEQSKEKINSELNQNGRSFLLESSSNARPNDSIILKNILMDRDQRDNLTCSSPEQHSELFWESNSNSNQSEEVLHNAPTGLLDFSSEDSNKCCKSPPSCEETNSTDSSSLGGRPVKNHPMRINSVIKSSLGGHSSAVDGPILHSALTGSLPNAGNQEMTQKISVKSDSNTSTSPEEAAGGGTRRAWNRGSKGSGGRRVLSPRSLSAEINMGAEIETSSSEGVSVLTKSSGMIIHSGSSTPEEGGGGTAGGRRASLRGAGGVKRSCHCCGGATPPNQQAPPPHHAPSNPAQPARRARRRPPPPLH